MRRTATPVLILALRQLADSIISTDGVANATIAEAADRLQEQAGHLRALREGLKPRNRRAGNPDTTRGPSGATPAPDPAADLTDEQRRQIHQAADQAYDELRWLTGDSRELLATLQRLARDSYLAGRRAPP